MEKLQIEKTKFVGELQDFINLWLKQSPDVRNIAYLSRETGVSDTAIRRIVNAGVKIADDSIFKIVAYIAKSDRFETLSDSLESCPTMRAWLTSTFAYLKKAPIMQDLKTSSLAEDICEGRDTFSVFSSISATPGVNAAYIKEQFGIRGELELEKLILKGAVLVKQGKLYPKIEKLRVTREQVIELLPEITKTFLKQDHAYNCRSLEIDAVSKVGYIKLMDEFDNFLAQTYQIFKDHPGEIPVVVAGFMDSFTTQPYFEGGKNEASN